MSTEDLINGIVSEVKLLSFRIVQSLTLRNTKTLLLEASWRPLGPSSAKQIFGPVEL